MLVRAKVAVAGGPPAGQVGEVDDVLGDLLVRNKLAVRVESLKDRIPDLDFGDDR